MFSRRDPCPVGEHQSGVGRRDRAHHARRRLLVSIARTLLTRNSLSFPRGESLGDGKCESKGCFFSLIHSSSRHTHTHIHTQKHREREKRPPTPSSRPSVRTIVQRVYVFLDISTAFGRAGCKPVHAFNKSDAYHTHSPTHSLSLSLSPSLPPSPSPSPAPHALRVVVDVDQGCDLYTSR